MLTGRIEANRSLTGDWDHAVLAEKRLVSFSVSPEGIRVVADALDEEEAKPDRNTNYYAGVRLEDDSLGSVTIGKIPSGLAEPDAYTTEPYWGDITLYVSTERLREIADRLETQPETLIDPRRGLSPARKEIAEIIGGIVVRFCWFVDILHLEERRRSKKAGSGVKV